MKKILVPIDYSPNSINALHVAAAIARKSGAVIEMLHVNLAAIYTVPFSEFATAAKFADEDERYDETATLELEKIKKELLAEPAYSSLDIKIRVQEGYLHSSVRDVAIEDKVDLVVMGTRGSTGMSEFLVGSNTEKVIRTAPCPVLAVPEHINEFAPKIVLLPSTLKNDQLGVFHYLAKWDVPLLGKSAVPQQSVRPANRRLCGCSKKSFCRSGRLEKNRCDPYLDHIF